MGGLFGIGGGSKPSPRPIPQVAAPQGETAAERARRRRIGRAALIKTDQEGQLGVTTGRNVLTAV